MPLRVNPHGFFFSSAPTSFHLLLLSPFIPLFLPSLMRAMPRFAQFLLFGQRVAPQQARCASRGLCEVCFASVASVVSFLLSLFNCLGFWARLADSSESVLFYHLYRLESH